MGKTGGAVSAACAANPRARRPGLGPREILAQVRRAGHKPNRHARPAKRPRRRLKQTRQELPRERTALDYGQERYYVKKLRGEGLCGPEKENNSQDMESNRPKTLTANLRQDDKKTVDADLESKHLPILARLQVPLQEPGVYLSLVKRQQSELGQEQASHQSTGNLCYMQTIELEANLFHTFPELNSQVPALFEKRLLLHDSPEQKLAAWSSNTGAAGRAEASSISVVPFPEQSSPAGLKNEQTSSVSCPLRKKSNLSKGRDASAIAELSRSSTDSLRSPSSSEPHVAGSLFHVSCPSPSPHCPGNAVEINEPEDSLDEQDALLSEQTIDQSLCLLGEKARNQWDIDNSTNVCDDSLVSANLSKLRVSNRDNSLQRHKHKDSSDRIEKQDTWLSEQTLDQTVCLLAEKASNQWEFEQSTLLLPGHPANVCNSPQQAERMSANSRD